MPETRTACEIAEHMIRSATKNVDFGEIGDVIGGKHPDLADDQDAFDRLHRDVDDLIPKAVITITWPDTEANRG